jgi:hypothetical protein
MNDKRFYKLVSILLHPILLPVVGVQYFFYTQEHTMTPDFQLKVTTLVFLCTFVLPLILLTVLKKMGKIKSFDLPNGSERKVPFIVSIALFYVLGSYLGKSPLLLPLARLYIGCSLAISFAYVVTNHKLKISIHMIGMGTLVALVVLTSLQQPQNQLFLVACSFVASGLAGQARLHLKAHNSREVYIGFMVGICSQILAHTNLLF